MIARTRARMAAFGRSILMGLLDHRRMWRYRVKASPQQCTDAFGRAFSGRAGLANAKWDVRRSGRGAVAVYTGRKGLGALGGILSGTQALEQDTAVGSKVEFRIEESTHGQTTCCMGLTFSGRAGIGGLMGTTSDARFIRPYMQAVEKELRGLDSGLVMAKGLGQVDDLGPSTALPVSRRTVAPRDGESEWTCPTCGHTKNPAGRVRCAQCRNEFVVA